MIDYEVGSLWWILVVVVLLFGLLKKLLNKVSRNGDLGDRIADKLERLGEIWVYDIWPYARIVLIVALVALGIWLFVLK